MSSHSLSHRVWDIGQVILQLSVRLLFESSFRFIAKLRGESRDIPLMPDTNSFPLLQPPLHSMIFTVDGPTLILLI